MEKNEDMNRVNQLINVVEDYTRTERHLEQHSDIGNPNNIKHAEKIQRERERDIDTLKQKIAYGTGSSKDVVKNELNNLEKNYEYAEGYMKHNAENMPGADIKNLKDKQENRKEKMDELRFK